MSPLVWALLLLVLALALIALEMFVPSGGVIAVLATAAVVAAVVMVFVNEGPLLGFLFLAATSIVLPVAVATAIRWWPHTPMGRLILNLPPEADREALLDREEDPRLALLGKRGHAVSDMLLSGAVSINGKSYDAVSDTTAIDRGEPIQVVAVEGNRILVRPVDAAPPPPRVAAESPQDLLSQPVDDVIPDPFDEPLT